MSTVVVNDASCLIDLHKGRLLDAMLTLPYRFVAPLPIRRAEAPDLTEREWRRLEHGGLVPFDLPPEQVAEAAAVKARHPKLSANDCFCLVATRCHDGGILLTGDRLLRQVASQEGLRVHGVLWIVESQNALGQAGLLVGADKIVRVDVPEPHDLMKLDDWERAAQELPTAAERALAKHGNRVAAMFLSER